MILLYGKYLDLLSSLDEYTQSHYSKSKLQDLIYTHYTNSYSSFLAQNQHHEIIRISKKSIYRDEKREKKRFRNHMNGKHKVAFI